MPGHIVFNHTNGGKSLKSHKLSERNQANNYVASKRADHIDEIKDENLNKIMRSNLCEQSKNEAKL